jgi:hypothetical protein
VEVRRDLAGVGANLQDHVFGSLWVVSERPQRIGADPFDLVQMLSIHVSDKKKIIRTIFNPKISNKIFIKIDIFCLQMHIRQN